jgi:MFS transporter, putative metabolite:H+ symporter
LRRVFPICLLTYAASQMELALFGYALPEIRRQWHLDLETVGDSVAIAFVLGGIALPALGALSDRLGRKRVLLASSIASPLLVASLALSGGIAVLTLIRAAAIAAGGLSYPVTGALVSETSPARFRGLFAGLLQAGYPLGWFVASLLASAVLAESGWRMTFALALLGLPIAAAVALWLPESPRFDSGSDAPRTSWRELFRPALRARTATLFLAQFLFVLAYGGTSILFPLYFREARGFDLITSTRLVGLGNAIAIVGYVGAALVGEFLMTRRNTVVMWTMAGGASFLWLIWGTTTAAQSLIAFGVMAMFFYGAAAVKFAYVAAPPSDLP